MPVTWASVRDRAKDRYGLARSSDQLLTDELFLGRVNELLADFADVGKGFRESFTLNLSGSSRAHALDERVRQVIEGTVRVDYDGSTQFRNHLRFLGELGLREAFGDIELTPASVPAYWYVQRGMASGSTMNLMIYPQSDTARTGGLKLEARVTAAAVTEGSSLPVQLGEERFLIPGICLALAECELSRGAQGAGGKIELWERRWEQALARYADLVEDGTRGDRRRIHVVDDVDRYDEWGW